MKSLAWTHHQIVITHQISWKNLINLGICNDLLRRLRCSKDFYSQHAFVATHQNSANPNANAASQRFAKEENVVTDVLPRKVLDRDQSINWSARQLLNKDWKMTLIFSASARKKASLRQPFWSSARPWFPKQPCLESFATRQSWGQVWHSDTTSALTASKSAMPNQAGPVQSVPTIRLSRSCPNVRPRILKMPTHQ